jgi:polyisoprenoid-binding protein YceI
MKTGILLLSMSFWLTGPGPAVLQGYILSGDYAVSIHGTINVHNWSEVIQKVSGELVGSANGDANADIKSIRIVMEVRSITSDMGSVMNSKTYKALKGDADPEITFLLTDPVRISRMAEGDKSVLVKGRLTLAGVTREVMMSVRSFTVAAGKMSIEGEEKINMTDFGVIPPSALFGTMRAAPEITINFKTDFTIQQP